MTRKIIECVPNFSEGRDMTIINRITQAIEAVEGIMLLDVDPGRDTNRTVVTFAGAPDAVSEAAFEAVRKASELIDMSKHKGAHPRMGATDVLPFVPVSGVTMEEVAELARKTAARIGKELGIPVYCYENAAYTPERRNLAYCREGEYEGLERRVNDPGWKPDFGPHIFNRKSGAIAVGARDFLVAYNVNLNTTSVRRANAIAFDVREKGRKIKDERGMEVNVPGTLKKVKAIGWFIEEYNTAQISMNLTDISVTPVHVAFDEVCIRAGARGIRVTGSELVGLIPLKAMLDAGRYFLEKQQRSAGVSDRELINIAVRTMGMSEIHPFNPDEKIIEYVMEKKEKSRKLTDLSLKDYMELTASESPAPGGGSAAAYIGSLGAALGTMVANLSSHKKGWDDRWKEFSDIALEGKEIQNELLVLVDEDTRAFNMILEAYRLPKNTDGEKTIRQMKIDEAVKNAVSVPLRVMQTALRGFKVVRSMAENGNPNSVSDAAVGAMALEACVMGAFLNVKINCRELDDKAFVDEVFSEAQHIAARANSEKAEIVAFSEKIIRS